MPCAWLAPRVALSPACACSALRLEGAPKRSRSAHSLPPRSSAPSGRQELHQLRLACSTAQQCRIGPARGCVPCQAYGASSLTTLNARYTGYAWRVPRFTRLTRPLLNSLTCNSSALRPVALTLPPSAPAQPTTHPMPLLLPPRLAAAQGLALLVTSSQSSVAPSLPLPTPASCIAGLSLTRDKRSVPQSRTDPLCRAQYAALPEFSKARYSIAPSIAWPMPQAACTALLLTHSFGTQLQPPLRFHQGH